MLEIVINYTMQRSHTSEAAEGKQRSLLPLGMLCIGVESLAGFRWNFVKAEETECVCLDVCAWTCVHVQVEVGAFVFYCV